MNIANKLHVLSYNIWFEEIVEKERLYSLIEMVKKIDPDVICLQEVKPCIYTILIEKLQNYKYHFPKKIDSSYGCVIFSKYSINKCMIYPFTNSMMGRSMIISKIDYPYYCKDNDNTVSIEKVEIVLVTTHFESIFNRKYENTIKIDQFKIAEYMINQLYDKYKNVIFCVDTNIIDNEEEKFILTNKPSKWLDAWKEKGDTTNQYTFDSFNNVYLKFKKCKYRSRLDRIIYRCDSCNLEKFDIIKYRNLDIDNIIEPSDHFGILIKFEINI